MKQQISVSAPGKIILLGEHAVVYGKAAIIAAIDKRCFAIISKRNDNRVKIISINLNKQIITDVKKINAKFKNAQKDYTKYDQVNDIEILKSITTEPLDYAQVIVGQFLDYFKINLAHGFNITIDSEIPIGAGMGSSGATAVSIIGSLFIFFNKNIDKKIINEIAFLAEQKKHGNPSGADNCTSTFGGLIWFIKDQDIKFLDIKLSPAINKNLYIINTGTPYETTGEMVALVKKLNTKNPLLTNKIFANQEKLVYNLHAELKKKMPDKIIDVIKMGEKNLEKLGVVSPSAQKIVEQIEMSGGAAKICGGGGKKGAAGILLVYHPNRSVLKNMLESQELTLSQINLGTEGLKIEL